MHLPPEIRQIIDKRAEVLGFSALKRAAAAMSEAYRAGDLARIARMPGSERAAAYLVTRMPATYAAAFRVVAEVQDRLNGQSITSVLDVGAGTGAASLAARHWFPGAAMTLLERDSAFAEVARECLRGAALLMDDAARAGALPPHDLVIACYSLGELPAAAIDRAWSAARFALAVIEPGTPAGFERIRAWRGRLLAQGAHMIAPCPAASPCPLTAPDWCHFGARVERSAWHRRVKHGDLNYEDEKFSYLAVARQPATPAGARIIRRPEHCPGLVTLHTCTPAGTATAHVPHRDRARFRAARAAIWGDAWSDDHEPAR